MEEQKTIRNEELREILNQHKLWLENSNKGERANLSYANLSYANLSYADLSGADLSGANLSRADLDFSQLNLSCKGLNFKIDENLAKQIAYHLINLMQYSGVETKKWFKKRVYKDLETSHIVTQHSLSILKEKE